MNKAAKNNNTANEMINNIVFHKPVDGSFPMICLSSVFVKVWHYLEGFYRDEQTISKISGALNKP